MGIMRSLIHKLDVVFGLNAPVTSDKQNAQAPGIRTTVKPSGEFQTQTDTRYQKAITNTDAQRTPKVWESVEAAYEAFKVKAEHDLQLLVANGGEFLANRHPPTASTDMSLQEQAISRMPLSQPPKDMASGYVVDCRMRLPDYAAHIQAGSGIIPPGDRSDLNGWNRSDSQSPVIAPKPPTILSTATTAGPTGATNPAPDFGGKGSALQGPGQPGSTTQADSSLPAQAPTPLSPAQSTPIPTPLGTSPSDVSPSYTVPNPLSPDLQTKAPVGWQPLDRTTSLQ